MHILAGGNGAGKSALIRFLTGSDRASRGSILIDGRHPVEHPQMFRKIAYVPQELPLFPDVSAAENLFMPSDRTGHGGLVNRRRMEAQAQTYLERFGIEARPSDLVRHISVPDQQHLQITRAWFNRDMKVLILDEPTAALTARKVSVSSRSSAAFRTAITRSSSSLTRWGRCSRSATITHCVQRREGGGRRRGRFDEPRLIRAMSGREVAVDDHFRPDTAVGETLPEVEDLARTMFDDVSFKLRLALPGLWARDGSS